MEFRLKLRVLFARIRGSLGRQRREELDDEIGQHLTLLTERYVEQGLSQNEARSAARRQFGGVTQMKETIRERSGLPLIEQIFQDVQYALRQLRRSSAFTVTATLVLALGVGANTAIFSVIDGVLLRPLPYSDSNRLVWLGETLKGNSTDDVTLTPDFLDWRDQNTVFTGTAAFNLVTRTLTNASEPWQLRTAKASFTLLPILGVQPLIGRNFLKNEDWRGRDQVALISYGLWKRQFGSQQGVLGRAVTLDDRVYTVIGVLPPSFHFPSPGDIDVISPLGKNEEVEAKRRDGLTIVHDVIARLKPGVTLKQARAQMEIIESHISPPAFFAGMRMTIHVSDLRTHLVGNLRASLIALLWAVGFLLLMGCANVSNLLLSRAIGRQREMAIRSSLGASPSRIVRQLLIESGVLAMLGCGVGLLLAFCTRGALWRLLPESVPGLEKLPLDWRVFSFAVGSACATAIAFGLGPALASAGGPLSDNLAIDGRFVFGKRRHFWLNALASVQLAMAIVLLCGGGLMLRSFWNLRYRNLGFRTDHLLTAQLHLGRAKYVDIASQIFFLRRLIERISVLPGVEAVAIGNLPPGEGHATNGFAVEGRAMKPEGQKPVARGYPVSPAYFRTLQIPVLKGRDFSERDTESAARVAVVSETFARRNFPDEDPVGRRLRRERQDPWSTIVGVVADVRGAGLTSPAESIIYLPYAQVGAMDEDVGILVRSAFSMSYMEPELRKTVSQLDAQEPITEMRSMDQRLNESAAKPRLATLLLGCFAILGLVLATVGLHGVMSLLVNGRLRDIGIRLAVGARPEDVLLMVLCQSGKIILIGIGAGLCCALWLTRLMRGLLFQVSAFDPVILMAVTGFLALVGMSASYFPARRAARVDPLAMLRAE